MWITGQFLLRQRVSSGQHGYMLFRRSFVFYGVRGLQYGKEVAKQNRTDKQQGARHKMVRRKKFAILLAIYDLLENIVSYFLGLYIRFDLRWQSDSIE